ncbi:MAG: hypothetical protein QM817_28040 [Archangium sp.]
MLAILLGADAGSAPLPSAFSKVVFESAAVLEIEVPLDASLKATPRWAKGLERAKPLRIIASRAVMDAPEKLDGFKKWEVLRSCLGLTNGRASVKVLVLQTGNPPAWSLFPLATMGFAMESTPGYAQLVAAVSEAYGWHEERMRAVGADQLWQAERKALQSDNPYLRHLAAEFLIQHDAATVVDELWGAPGSEQREKSEAASRIVPECKS